MGGGAAARTAAAAAKEEELRPLDVSHSVHVLLLAGAIPFVVFSGHATSYPMLAFCLGGWSAVVLHLVFAIPDWVSLAVLEYF